MRLPDFLIIGAQKSGTSWLAWQLRAHPGVFMPRDELHFFNRPDRYARGLEWYAGHFEETGADQLAGEKTPNYLFLPRSRRAPNGHFRIAKDLPDVRLIAVLRDPVARAVSAINHVLREGFVSPFYSVDDLLGTHRGRISWLPLEVGLYASQLAAFFDVFGRDRVLVLFYEDDVVESPESGVRAACAFLNVAPELDDARLTMQPNTSRRSWLRLALDHHAPALRRWTHRLDRWLPPFYGSASEETLQRLYAYYAPHNEDLFEMLGRRPAFGWQFASLR